MEIRLTDKFIGYIDILGYSSLTRAAEAGKDLSLGDLEAILQKLGTEADREHHQKYGPTICPRAPRLHNDLDFQITQVWDSVVVSTEISPAGIISLVSHCLKACIGLLVQGVMCRGYIKRGMIYHTGQRILGSGHVDTVAKEKSVTFFRQDADERGTPFIEIDPEVVEYVANLPDKCVSEMFERMVLQHNGLTAVFPIKRFYHSFTFGGARVPPFDPTKEKKNNNTVREGIKGLQQKLMKFVDTSDATVVRKANHYIHALDEQLKVCDRTDETIDMLCQSFGRRFTKEAFPGLFH
jgi:hypothetical protein